MPSPETVHHTVRFVDNPSIRGRAENFTIVTVSVPAVLESWRESLFSHEWLWPDGRIRGVYDMPERERLKRIHTEAAILAGDPLPRPVLGIGISDNVEIGAAREVFLSLAAQGVDKVEAHIPKSNLADLRPFLSAAP